MIIQPSLSNNIEINELRDLRKLRHMKEYLGLSINCSKIARELDCDRRTVNKYINGIEKNKTRNRKFTIDKYYDKIVELLNSKTQTFYYKRILWQFLKDNYGLKCSESTFRSYITRKNEFNKYFISKKKTCVSNKTLLRFETGPGEQAQLDWKEKLILKLKD